MATKTKKTTPQPADDAPVYNEVTLLNTMDRDMHVLVNGKRKKLHRAPAPVLLHSAKDKSDTPLSVNREPSGDATELDFYTREAVIGILHEPVEYPGVLYLVEPEVIQEFPHRADFVTPALFGMKRSAKKKRFKMRDYLIAVTRTPYAVADKDTPVLVWEENE
jgi:hypothetical protein